MSRRGTGRESVADFALAVAGHPEWRLGTRTATERVYRDFRPSNTTVSISERALRVKIEITRPWRDRIINPNRTVDLPHPFVILVRELRICKDLAFPCLPLTFTSTQHPTLTRLRELDEA